MPIKLPDHFRERLQPFAKKAGVTVDEAAAEALDDWLSWREAQPALDAALDGPPAEPLTSEDFEAIRREVRARHPNRGQG